MKTPILLSIGIFATACVKAKLVGSDFAATNKAAPMLFAFGEHESIACYSHVKATNFYSTETGCGFEPDAEISGEDYAKSDKPFYFSVKLPEGNYKVTTTFGGESTVTVKSELRRLMLEKIHAAPGKVEARSFVCNVRTPVISESNRVHLKQREQETEMVDSPPNVVVTL